MPTYHGTKPSDGPDPNDIEVDNDDDDDTGAGKSCQKIMMW